MVSGFIADLPIVRDIVRREQDKVVTKLRADIRRQRKKHSVLRHAELPDKKIGKSQILRYVQDRQRILGDASYSEGKSQASGAIYLDDGNLKELLNSVYSLLSISNPMHSDMFPSVRHMEAEVIEMSASLVGGGAHGVPGIVGAMTSGGTESILTAVKASRDYMVARKGIKNPEMIVAPSAHAAFIKAAEYFRIRLVKAPLDENHALTAKAVRKYINKNTVLVVASSPGFPHGVMDDIQGIAEVCKKKKVLLHVDACLGGFVLPFLKYLDIHVPKFDFSIDGVTSMSLDTHKFGCAHKGTSVVLYRGAGIRKYQYTTVTDWTGGLYISPGFAGSRSGALITTAWAALLYNGIEGYVENTRRMMSCASILISSIEEDIPELYVVGSPVMCLVAFASRTADVDIYVVNDLMSAKGWHLNALQHPAALHMCFTPAHSKSVAEKLTQDLKESVCSAKAQGGSGSDGTAPLYGMAAKVPDRRVVGNFLIAYQDILLEP